MFSVGGPPNKHLTAFGEQMFTGAFSSGAVTLILCSGLLLVVNKKKFERDLCLMVFVCFNDGGLSRSRVS